MLKALIVDDEVLSIKIMENIIDWTMHGIQIVATASDGMEAFEKFQAYAPNIIISDIKMPKLDGIEFIKKVREINSEVEFLFISAYADFDFVKVAISLGCTNYLLKPIDELELEKTLQTIISKITGKDIVRKLMISNEKQKKKKIILNYIKSGLRPQAACKLIEEVNFKEPFVILCINLNNETINSYTDMNSYMNDRMGYILEKIEEMIRKHCGYLSFDFEECSWSIILFSSSVPNITAVAEEILQFLTEAMKLNVKICFSRSSAEVSELPELYKQVQSYLKYSLYVNDSDILGYGYNCNENEFNKIKVSAHTRNMLESLKLCDTTEALCVLESVLKLSRSISPEDLNCIYEFCFETVMYVKSTMITESEAAPENSAPYSLTYEQIVSVHSIDELRELMIDVINSISLPVRPQECKYCELIEKGIEFLDSNYNRNISLDEISKHLSVSKNYFSYLFKRDTGISIWAYLTDIRMNKSKELLEKTNMKSYEVAYNVGYDNPSYFSKTFKKRFKQSPSEYRINRETKEIV